MSSTKKIFFLANIRLPTEKAHGLQIMKTCEALLGEGADVTLVVPDRHNTIAKDPFAFYQVSQPFPVVRVRCWDLVSSNRLGWLGFWLESCTYFVSAVRFLQKQPDNRIIYTRDTIIAFLLSCTRSSFVYEMHTVPQHLNVFTRFMLRRAKQIITISHGIKTKLLEASITSGRISVIPDAVDVNQFTKELSQAESRRTIGIPEKGDIVVYTGHLYAWKGAHTLAEAAKQLSGVEVYLVGGTERDIVSFTKTYGTIHNLHIVGWVPHEQIPNWLYAADVLVLPNSAKEDIGALYTSPLKLFEYLCTGRPMVVSNVPALREIVNETVSTLFTPDDSTSLAHAIEDVLKHSDVAKEKAARARSLAQEYSWNNRAKQILEVLKTV